MRKLLSTASRWVAGTALVATFALSATPAMADHERGRSRGPSGDRREYRQDRRQESRRDDRGGQWRWYGHARAYPGRAYHHRPQVIVKPRVVVRPRVVYRYESVMRRHLPYPVWCAPQSRVFYHDEQPFFFNAALGVFLSGAQFWVQVGNVPPPGYGYYDPYSGGIFFSVDEYRAHCGQDHEPVLQLVSLDDQGYDGGQGYGD